MNPAKNIGVKSGAREAQAVPVSYTTPEMFLKQSIQVKHLRKKEKIMKKKEILSFSENSE